jgi:hypothetical protein
MITVVTFCGVINVPKIIINLPTWRTVFKNCNGPLLLFWSKILLYDNFYHLLNMSSQSIIFGIRFR